MASRWIGLAGEHGGWRIELPENGGGFVFRSPWGIPDLLANFDDSQYNLTMSTSTIGDPDPFWNQGGGGPGAPGNFSISMSTNLGLGRHVQWGFQVRGVNVCVTDVELFGSMGINTVPAPASLGLLAFCGIASRRRR